MLVVVLAHQPAAQAGKSNQLVKASNYTSIKLGQEKRAPISISESFPSFARLLATSIVNGIVTHNPILGTVS